MARNNILDTIKKILEILKDSEMSINMLAGRLQAQWKTTNRALNFLKDINLVEEREGKKALKSERLFSLKG